MDCGDQAPLWLHGPMCRCRSPATNNRVLLKWSTSAVGYNLVATNALGNPPQGFAPIGPAPVVVGGKFTVTNNASGANRFYELRKP